MGLLMPMADLAMEESFAGSSASKETPFRDDLLVLVRFLFKTVKLSSLVQYGFTHRHMQFVLVHFAKSSSSSIPMVCEFSTHSTFTLFERMNLKEVLMKHFKDNRSTLGKHA
jgi:hypothetical protein